VDGVLRKNTFGGIGENSNRLVINYI